MLNNIPKLTEQDNFGGGKYILYVDYKGIDVFPSVINDNIVDDITLLAGYQWFRIDFPQQVLHYRGEPNEENGGRGNYNSISAFLPKDSLELQLITAAMRTKRFVVLYFDSNGFQRVLGNKKKPAIFRRVSTDHKLDFAGRNEREILIEWPTREEPPFYQATPPEPALVCTPVNELTCIELNNAANGLTMVQRGVINLIKPRNTGQTTSYFSRDSADRLPGTGVDFFTLDCLNLFGVNSDRFTDTLGGTSYADDIIVDHKWPYMIYRIPQGTVSDWDTGMSNANAMSIGGFTDWFIPDEAEIQLWKYNDQADMYNWPPLNIAASPHANLWTGSTVRQLTTNAYRVTPVNGDLIGISKGTAGIYYFVVRKYVPADLGL